MHLQQNENQENKIYHNDYIVAQELKKNICRLNCDMSQLTSLYE